MPTPTTQNLLQQAENYLDEIDVRINTTLPDRNQAAAMLEAVIPIRADLADFLDNWQQIIDRMHEYVDALTEPTTEQGYKTALDLFEILLAPAEDLSDPNKWGNLQRLQNAYGAVRNIIVKIATEFSGGSSPTNDHKLHAALLFIDAFGGTELRIEPSANPNDPDAAASTDILPRGPVIYLYLTVGSNTNHIHTVENIVHEFGHVLVFRNGTYTSEIYKEWYVSWNGTSEYGIGEFISNFPNDPTLGWGANANNLQNTSANEIEQERLANMFEAFVTGYDPAINSDDTEERRAAWALYTFMTGECPPTDVNIDIRPGNPERPCGHGLMYWLQFYESQS